MCPVKWKLGWLLMDVSLTKMANGTRLGIFGKLLVAINMNNVLNFLWLLFHWGELQSFAKRIDQMPEYSRHDVWYNRHIGFICYPNFEEME